MKKAFHHYNITYCCNVYIYYLFEYEETIFQKESNIKGRLFAL